ncbi:hypothetical protein BWI15_11570 [Kribbella sp. ALI-6-A]|uniref:hypothetical protein n=1 Tax=Kribbella sp. ALI-6-A TaxID=1933817 RepID=UPI00097CB050|nr:hypothetical protein [Kribbella sp. ALI-6-A]ONI74012.1 hypothetical protein BWI15_11570 [Kribbella sp. ALI-6-A]
MNDTERRLIDELDRAASEVQVDVDRMWNAVQQRTDVQPEPPARPWSRRLAPYLAAASVAAILLVAGASLVDGTEPDTVTVPAASPRPTTKTTNPSKGPTAGPIGDWACGTRTVLSPGTDSMTSKPIRAVLDPLKAPPEAVAYGVPRYRFTLSGTTGVLDYGDASGHRIARTELTRTATGWLVGDRTVCSGAGGRPSPDPVRLGAHTKSPLPLDPRAAQLRATPMIGRPVLIDDRTYYDPAGMLRQATLYAFATQGGYQFVRMPADDGGIGQQPQPEDQIRGADPLQLAGADDTHVFAGHTPFFGVVFSYLTNDKTVEGLSLTTASTGEPGPAQSFALPGGRTLYTVVPVSPVDGDSLVTVHRTTGDEPPRRF